MAPAWPGHTLFFPTRRRAARDRGGPCCEPDLLLKHAPASLPRSLCQCAAVYRGPPRPRPSQRGGRMPGSQRQLGGLRPSKPAQAPPWLTLLAGKSRYQSTGRLRPVAGPDWPARLMARGAIAFALVGLAVAYWFWPNDLVPDWKPWGRADDLAVAFVNCFAAVRVVSTP